MNTLLWYAITTTQLTAVSVTPSLSAPQSPGTAITLTADATGGADVQYLFWVYNPEATPAWNLLQAFCSQNTCNWTPAMAGSYMFSVTAQDGVIGTEVNTMLWYTITNQPLTAVSLTCSPLSPQQAGTLITLTATATGGTDVQYQFWVYNPAATPAWSQLQAYSTQNACTWMPAEGNCLLSVTAQDGITGAEVNTLLWYSVTAPLTAISVTPSLDAPQPPNTSITLTASAVGGANVQYQFWVYNPNATPAWSQLQAYSPQNSCIWTPATVGTYLLSITAQDDDIGNEVNTMLWYTIQ